MCKIWEARGSVAQRLEQQTHNLLGLGSNPSGPTTRINYFPRNFRFASYCKVRGSCILLRSCFEIQAIDPRDVRSRNKMPIRIHRHLDGTVAHLILHVGQRGAVPDEQAAEGVSQIMEAESTQARAVKAWVGVVVR